MGKCTPFALLASAIYLVSAVQTSAQGYYWRDFEGIIPEDALAGGLDQNGRPIYIGQVLFESKFIPGKIYENDKNIYFRWGPEQATNANVKILCTQHAEIFEWILTKPDKITTLTNKLLVKGGYEPEYFTYIGRVYSGLETTIGKVICRVTDCLGLHITKDGKGIQHTGEFEILSYNPNNSVTSNYSNCAPITMVE